MNLLEVTLIDVGWGDSILIASEENERSTYALIDSNDTPSLRSSFIFLKRYFEKKEIDFGSGEDHFFEFVLLTHAHADHAQGLKGILRSFGTKNFWYPKSLEWGSSGDLIRFANTSKAVSHHQSIDETKIIPPLGAVGIKVLWPLRDRIDKKSENNNSVVLTLTLGNVSFVLTGDAEGEVWEQIADQIPANTQFFKLPHHGSQNGTFGRKRSTPWLNRCPAVAKLGISSHIKPFHHPDKAVIDLLTGAHRTFYRTDESYHLTFKTDGTALEVKHSHF